MKKLIALCSLILLVGIAIAGGNKTNPIPFDSATQKFAYRKIVEVPGATANALYLRSKNWSKVKFADEKFLIDEPDAKLTTLGNFTVNVTMKAMMKIPFVYIVTYTVSTEFKDGKSKIDITNIKLSQNAKGNSAEQTLEGFEKQVESMGIGKNMAKPFMFDVCNEIDTNLLKVIAELEAALKGSNKISDW